MIVTEWEQLVGKKIVGVEQFFLGGYLLLFEDGDYTHVDGDGEEQHGGHWPILCEDDQDSVKGAVQSMQRRKQVKEATNGKVFSNDKGQEGTQSAQLKACCDAFWRNIFHRAKAPTRWQEEQGTPQVRS